MAYTFPEFANNKRLQWIAREWDRYSMDLADWAMERLVNRRDVWGQYTLRDGEVGFITLPGRKQRALGSHMVTLNKLTHHFQAHSTADVISLHSISDHRTAKWFAIDIDLHDESIANADDQAAANLEAGLEWARRLREALFDPLFLDTNGVGGYHLWCLLDDEYPLADVYDYVSEPYAPISPRSAWPANPRPSRRKGKSRTTVCPIPCACRAATRGVLSTRASAIFTGSARTTGSKGAKRSRPC